MKRLVVAALAVTLVSGTAWADVTMMMSRKDLTKSDAPLVNGRTSLTAEKALSSWDPEKEGGEGTHVIYRGDKQVIWVLTDKDKKYTEISKADVDQMGAQIDDSMAKMKKEMEGMPADQRAMMEKMMAKMGGGGKAPVRVVKKTDDSKTINGFPCTRYLVSLDGKASSEIWATPYEKFNVKAADMKVLEDMMKMFESLTSRFQGMGSRSKGMVNGDGVDGVPIQTTMFDRSGKPVDVTTVESVTRDAVPAADFELPAGCKKQEFGDKH